MANLIQVDARQKRLIPLLAERVLPVLDLRIPWEEKLLLPNLKQQNDARVIHFLVERAHDFEQLLAAYRACMVDQPARVDARVAAAFHVPWEQGRPLVLLAGGQCGGADLKMPELVGIARAFFLIASV